MSLLHALWDGDGLVPVADAWCLADRQTPVEEPLVHPFALSRQDLHHALTSQQLLPDAPLEPVDPPAELAEPRSTPLQTSPAARQHR